MSETASQPARPVVAHGLLLLAVLALSANLRAVIASVPPLTRDIATDLGLSSGWMGALTALPVLCMGLFAPPTHRAAARLGATTPISIGVALIAAGSGLRAWSAHTWPLYAGTMLAGIGIAVVGTLLPGLVKRLFAPERAGLVTGAYMLTMMGGAGLASAISVPLASALGPGAPRWRSGGRRRFWGSPCGCRSRAASIVTRRRPRPTTSRGPGSTCPGGTRPPCS